MGLIRLYADFNNQDEQGRVWIFGPDLDDYREQLQPGLPVILYTQPEDYVEVEAVLVYEESSGSWLAVWGGSRLDSVEGDPT